MNGPVEGGRWSPRTLLAAAGLAFGLGAALVFFPADPGSGSDVKLPRAALKTSSGKPVELATCPTEKCLTVVVAPWCGYCRSSTEKIVELDAFLAARKVTTRVVISMDQADALADYGREFGPGALLDDAGLVRVRGVPHFIVSDAAGSVLDTAAGVPPDGIRSVSDFAARLGLP